MLLKEALLSSLPPPVFQSWRLSPGSWHARQTLYKTESHYTAQAGLSSQPSCPQHANMLLNFNQESCFIVCRKSTIITAAVSVICLVGAHCAWFRFYVFSHLSFKTTLSSRNLPSHLTEDKTEDQGSQDNWANKCQSWHTSPCSLGANVGKSILLASSFSASLKR